MTGDAMDRDQQQVADRAVWSAADLHALADVLAGVAPAALPADVLDQLDALERVKSAAAAAQAVLTTTFVDTVQAADAQDPATEGRRRPPRAVSLGAEVALAVRTSPHAGERRLLLSARLVRDLPGVWDALARGELDEHRAFAVAREVAHLTPAQRCEVDADLTGRVAGLGEVRLRQAVRRACLRVAADAETHRCRRARAERHVTTRTLDDGTGRLTAVVPLEHLATVRHSLDAAAASARAAGDDRTPGQVRADTLIARVTGHDPTTPAPTRVDLVIGVESLLGTDPEPGLLHGLGWLPAGLCTDLVHAASRDAKATLRRLFTAPDTGHLVAMESTRRTFDGLLGELLDLRDGGVCRTPGCNAAIRHRDHVHPHTAGGPTTAHNGQGLCERCNDTKQTPGWATWTHTPPDRGPIEVHGVTEHLRLHTSTPPPMPGTHSRTGLELTLAPVHHFTLHRRPRAG